jgi:hypothetical protein
MVVTLLNFALCSLSLSLSDLLLLTLRSEHRTQGPKRVCGPADISKTGPVNRGAIITLDRECNVQPHQEMSHRERAVRRTTRDMASSADVESENSLCLSSGSLSRSPSGSQTTGEAESSIACLEHAYQAEPEHSARPAEVVDLDDLIRQQQESICRRRQVAGPAIQNLKQRRGVANNRRGDGQHWRSSARVQTLDGKWMAYLRTLPGNVFDSREALQNRAESAVRGRPLFSGLRVDEENCADMQRVYRLSFESKIRLGQPRGTYDQFRSAAGQYLRTYLSFHTDRALEMCKCGRLFEAVADFRLVRAFIGQYQVRASATTVMGKAMHLRRLADEAVSYFTEKNSQELKGRCMSVASYLRSVSASYKTEARRFYRTRNNADDRMERGALLIPADFDRCLSRSMQTLSGVMGFVEQLREDNGGNTREICSALFSRKGVVEKWNINLLAALVLSGGGQRPQVYAQLEVLGPSELEHFKEECNGNKQYFSMRAGLEKTTRSMDLPTVLFPRVLLQFVSFHVLTLRPLLVQQILGGSRVLACKNLLLHTRRGVPLKSSDITRTLGRFFERIDPELSGITPMAIRGSYASMMLQAHRRKEIFRDLGEQDFLQFLAKQMNTSVEQLATTYASCDVDAFEDVANEMMGLLCHSMQDYDDGSASERQIERQASDTSPIGSIWS